MRGFCWQDRGGFNRTFLLIGVLQCFTVSKLAAESSRFLLRFHRWHGYRGVFVNKIQVKGEEEKVECKEVRNLVYTFSHKNWTGGF